MSQMDCTYIAFNIYMVYNVPVMHIYTPIKEELLAAPSKIDGH